MWLSSSGMQRSPGACGQAGLSQGECLAPQASLRLSGSPHRLVVLLPGGVECDTGCVIGRAFGDCMKFVVRCLEPESRAGLHCSCHLSLHECLCLYYLWDWPCVFIFSCVYIQSICFCQYMLILATGWTSERGGMAALLLLGCGIQQLIP